MKKIRFAALLTAFAVTVSCFMFSSAAGSDIYSAASISLNKTYNGMIAANSEKDFYKFTLPASGRITVNLKAYIRYSSYFIYDANGEEIISQEWNSWNSVTELYTTADVYDLTSGTYYFCMSKVGDNTGDYNFSVNFVSASESFSEPNKGSNNLMASADSVSLGRTYKGQLAVNDEKDFYRFSLSEDCKLKINITSYYEYTDFYVYDADGNEVLSDTWNGWNSTSRQYVDTVYVDLKKGTYYFCVDKWGSRTGNYSFMLNKSVRSMKLSKKTAKMNRKGKLALKAKLSPSVNEKITWQTSDRKVAVVSSSGVVTAKNAGYALITASVGDKVTAECKIYVRPGKPKLKKARAKTVKLYFSSKKTRYAVLKWTKISKADNYQIYYSKFRKKKYRKLTDTYSTSGNFVMKRKGRYYIKIRAVKNAGGKKIFGYWSNIKSIRLR